jgi:hypothetical protein
LDLVTDFEAYATRFRTALMVLFRFGTLMRSIALVALRFPCTRLLHVMVGRFALLLGAIVTPVGIAAGAADNHLSHANLSHERCCREKSRRGDRWEESH